MKQGNNKDNKNMEKLTPEKIAAMKEALKAGQTKAAKTETAAETVPLAEGPLDTSAAEDLAREEAIEQTPAPAEAAPAGGGEPVAKETVAAPEEIKGVAVDIAQPEAAQAGVEEHREKLEEEKREEAAYKEKIKEAEPVAEEAALLLKETKEERDLEKELETGRRDYAAALLFKEKASQGVSRMQKTLEFFHIKKKESGKTPDQIDREVAEANARIASSQGVLKESLKKYREYLLAKKRQELGGKFSREELDERVEKHAKEVVILTSVKEATEIYNLMNDKKIETVRGNKEWLLRAADWYRHQSTRNKLLISGALLGGAAAGGVIGGTVGAVMVGGVTGAQWVRRGLSGLGTAVGLEALIKRSQEKAAEKKITKEFGDDFLGALREKNDALDEKMFDILKGKKKEEVRRYVIAGAAGLVVGSGVAARAFSNLIPAEWKAAVGRGIINLAPDSWKHYFAEKVGVMLTEKPAGVRPPAEIPGAVEQPAAAPPHELTVYKGESPLLLAKKMYIENAKSLGYKPEMGDIKKWAEIASTRHIVGQYLSENPLEYEDLIKQIGEPPEDPIKLDQWLNKVPKSTFNEILHEKVPNLVYEGDVVRVDASGDITASGPDGDARLEHIEVKPGAPSQVEQPLTEVQVEELPTLKEAPPGTEKFYETQKVMENTIITTDEQMEEFSNIPESINKQLDEIQAKLADPNLKPNEKSLLLADIRELDRFGKLVEKKMELFEKGEVKPMAVNELLPQMTKTDELGNTMTDELGKTITIGIEDRVDQIENILEVNKFSDLLPKDKKLMDELFVRYFGHSFKDFQGLPATVRDERLSELDMDVRGLIGQESRITEAQLPYKAFLWRNVGEMKWVQQIWEKFGGK